MAILFSHPGFQPCLYNSRVTKPFSKVSHLSFSLKKVEKHKIEYVLTNSFEILMIGFTITGVFSLSVEKSTFLKGPDLQGSYSENLSSLQFSQYNVFQNRDESNTFV